MKSRLLLIALILATTTAMGDALPAEPADGQAQAAALLSRPQIEGTAKADVTVRHISQAGLSVDGQAKGGSFA